MSERTITLAVYDDVNKEDEPILKLEGKYRTKYWDSLASDEYYLGKDVDEPLSFSLAIKEKNGKVALIEEKNKDSIGAIVGYRSATTLITYNVVFNSKSKKLLNFEKVKDKLDEAVNDKEDKDINAKVAKAVRVDFERTKNSMEETMSGLLTVVKNFVAKNY